MEQYDDYDLYLYKLIVMGTDTFKPFPKTETKSIIATNIRLSINFSVIMCQHNAVLGYLERHGIKHSSANIRSVFNSGQVCGMQVHRSMVHKEDGSIIGIIQTQSLDHSRIVTHLSSDYSIPNALYSINTHLTHPIGGSRYLMNSLLLLDNKDLLYKPDYETNTGYFK